MVDRPILCCWCFVLQIKTVLDAESRCPVHGLVKDRILGLVRMDTRLLGRVDSEDD